MSTTFTAAAAAADADHVEILGLVVSDIEKYLDFKSTLRLAQTCHSIRDLLVDTTSSEDGAPKLKMSYFTACDPSLLRCTPAASSSSSSTTTTAEDPNPENNLSFTSLAYHALTKLHFPSLLRLDLPFIVGEGREQCFHYMAMNIGEARQLEELVMDVVLVIANDFKYSTEPIMTETTGAGAESDTDGLPDNECENTEEDDDDGNNNGKTLYDHFADNLARCKKLKIIKILNLFRDEEEDPVFPITSLSRFSFYGLGFFRAVTPLIQAHVLMGNQGGLEEVTLNLGNAPAPPRHWEGEEDDFPSTAASAMDSTSLGYPSWSENAALEFFTAVLSLHNMKEFYIHMDLASSPLLNDFLAAADIVHQRFGSIPSSEVLEKFSASGTLYKLREGVQSPLPRPLPLYPCLALLGNCPNMHTFMVRLPPLCWDDDGLTAVQKLMQNKPVMRGLGLYFHDYECTNSHIANSLLQTFLQYLTERAERRDNLISISCLKLSDDDDADEWEESLDKYYFNGEKCFSADHHGLYFKAVGQFVQW